MRALFIAPNLGTGGAQRQWSVLLPLLRDHGIEPKVLTLDGRGRFFDELQAGGIDCQFAASGFPAALRQTMGAVRLTTAFDVVVTRGVSAEVVGAAVAAVRRVPLIVTAHTPRPLRPRQVFLQRLVARRVAGVIAVSPSQIRGLAAAGFDSKHIRVIPNGVKAPPPGVIAERSRVRSELGLADDDLAVLLVAALRPEKRGGDFVAGVRAARSAEARVRGFVAGDGPERARIEHAAGEDVLFLGDRGDVPELMAAADVVCLTSEAEALPMTLLEAAAAGRAMVATRVGGVEDIVIEGRTGHSVSVGDIESFASVLARLAAAPGDVASLGAEAQRLHASKFAEAAMVSAYADAITEIVTAHQTQGIRAARLKGAFRAATSRGPGYEPQPAGTRYSDAMRPGYYVDLRAKTQTDPRHAVTGGGVAVAATPTARAQLALGWLERYISGEEAAFDQFIDVAEQLLSSGEHGDRRLLWPYGFDFAKYDARAPWLSAMAQGQAASVLARAYVLTQDERYAKAAEAALHPLIFPQARDELVTGTPDGPILQEYPARGRSDVLNGWIYALWGLRDASVLLADQRAADVFLASSAALAARLHEYDLGWWSRYSLRAHDVAKPFYHRMHVVQLHVMADLTREPLFRKFAIRWASCDTKARASRAVAVKVTEVLAG
jgi:heparosan-N-sulfate-glucuronate 5-epimerase